jgi:arrestin-related trafficking adapter 9
VGLIAPPRERKVFLQTMKRRPKRKKPITPAVIGATKGHPQLTEVVEPISDRDSAKAAGSSNNSTMNLGNPALVNIELENAPRDSLPADIQSEISGESAASNNSASYSGQGAEVSGESASGSKKSGHDEREITATVELLKGGCLPGDIIPVKIRVEHNRYMKSLHGIIVTLYRQGRVDYAPPVVSFTGLSKEDVKRLERDDYYPRSKTGLGGLSLSSAGSCSVFRKDLSQAVAPLILDPATLTANITTAVRVPEGAFPSIRNVPGGLITFKYHVEVIVDLGGKLTGPSSGPSQPQQPTRIASSTSVRGTYGIDLNLANWNSTIIDTDPIRREKGVISVSFEVVVGTKNSSRSRGKAVERPAERPAVTARAPSQEKLPNEGPATEYDWQNTYDGEAEDYEYNPEDAQYPQSRYYSRLTSSQTAQYDYHEGHETQAPIYIPPPSIPPEDTLTDKERARRAEERLLPSRPTLQPVERGAGPSRSSAPSHIPNLATSSSSPVGLGPQSVLGPEVYEEPSAPTFGEIETTSPAHHIDDKQELERQRLMAEASAPREVPDDYDGGEPATAASNWTGPSPPWSQEPSAPILDEDSNAEIGGRYQDAMVSSNMAAVLEPLPKYER